MHLGFERVLVRNVALTAAAFTIPGNATHVELQADASSIRYTIDDVAIPTATNGMLLLVSEPPRLFLIEDLRRIRVIRSGANDVFLNVQYVAGRDV